MHARDVPGAQGASRLFESGSLSRLQDDSRRARVGRAQSGAKARLETTGWRAKGLACGRDQPIEVMRGSFEGRFARALFDRGRAFGWPKTVGPDRGQGEEHGENASRAAEQALRAYHGRRGTIDVWWATRPPGNGEES